MIQTEVYCDAKFGPGIKNPAPITADKYALPLKKSDACCPSAADKCALTLNRSAIEEGNVTIGDDKLLQIKGAGTVGLLSRVNGRLIEPVLSNVLYIPELKFKLFSVGGTLDKGLILRSDNKMCELVDNQRKVRAGAKRQNKLFKMDFVVKREFITSTNMCDSFLVGKVESVSVCTTDLPIKK